MIARQAAARADRSRLERLRGRRSPDQRLLCQFGERDERVAVHRAAARRALHWHPQSDRGHRLRQALKAQPVFFHAAA